MKRSTEKKKLDAALSRYVRKSNADDAGYAPCFTCGEKRLWQQMHCGHFITRAKLGTRYLYSPDDGLVNVMPQCVRCNMFLGGQQFVFSRNLDSLYGEGTAEKILLMSNQPLSMSTNEIVEKRKHYDELYTSLSN